MQCSHSLQPGLDLTEWFLQGPRWGHCLGLPGCSDGTEAEDAAQITLEGGPRESPTCTPLAVLVGIPFTGQTCLSLPVLTACDQGQGAAKPFTAHPTLDAPLTAEIRLPGRWAVSCVFPCECWNSAEGGETRSKGTMTQESGPPLSTVRTGVGSWSNCHLLRAGPFLKLQLT